MGEHHTTCQIPIEMLLQAMMQDRGGPKSWNSENQQGQQYVGNTSRGRGRGRGRGRSANNVAGKCYNCDAYGHYSRECPLKAQAHNGPVNNPLQNVICYNCNRYGHTARFCRMASSDQSQNN